MQHYCMQNTQTHLNREPHILIIVCLIFVLLKQAVKTNSDTPKHSRRVLQILIISEKIM